MKKSANKLYKKHRNLILYGVIGGSGALLDLIVFLVLFNVFNIPAVPATMISVLFGITNNFALNTIFNFKKTDRLWLRYISFTSVGLFGLFISAYILAFGEVFGFDANITKLLSIPPVVLLQYFLNRHISFRDITDNFQVYASLRQMFKNNWGLMTINVIFIISSLFFIKAIPFQAPLGGPDESIHYKANIGFIIENHRLPVSGKDDIKQLSTCRVNEYGAVPCIYSYNVYPAANYIFSATTAIALNSITGISLEKGARFASLAAGLVFLNFLYLIAVRLGNSRRFAWSIALIALIPQVIFVSSYVNQDAHSLAIAAVATFALIHFLQKKSLQSAIFAGIAIGGILPLAKYNYFILGLIALLLLGFALVRKIISYKIFARFTLAATISFVVLSSFWYIRNLVLYSDALGQSFVLEEMQKYHPLGVTLPYNYDTLQQFIGLGFFTDIFNSFFAAFGFMYVWLSDDVYTIIYALLLACVMYSAYILATCRKRHKSHLILTHLTLALTVALTLSLAVYNSITNDFQPQGRYLYPILPTLAAALALSYRYDERFKYIAWVFVFIVLFVYSESAFIVLGHYTP